MTSNGPVQNPWSPQAQVIVQPSQRGAGNAVIVAVIVVAVLAVVAVGGVLLWTGRDDGGTPQAEDTAASAGPSAEVQETVTVDAGTAGAAGGTGTTPLESPGQGVGEIDRIKAVTADYLALSSGDAFLDFMRENAGIEMYGMHRNSIETDPGYAGLVTGRLASYRADGVHVGRALRIVGGGSATGGDTVGVAEQMLNHADLGGKLEAEVEEILRSVRKVELLNADGSPFSAFWLVNSTVMYPPQQARQWYGEDDPGWKIFGDLGNDYTQFEWTEV